MAADLQTLLVALWVAGGAVWMAGAPSAKHTIRREPAAARVLHLAIVVLSYGLVFRSSFRLGPLDAYFISPTPLVEWTGFALTAAGIGIAVFARVTLGRNWSGTVTVKRGHELILRGPYGVVRHPIYSGLALALLGTSLFYARVGGLAGVALALVGWRLKSLTEEEFMVREFGAEYTDYKRRVKAMIPWVW